MNSPGSSPAPDRRAEFAEWSERVSREPALPVVVRVALPEDAPAVAALSAARDRTRADETLALVRREFDAIAAGDPHRSCCVALAEGSVVGYGRTRWMDLASDPAARNAPTGWYLNGLVVSPRLRRRGVGRALTEHRLELLVRLGADEAWYFANALNRVTIDLHERLGFEEVRRDFAIPGVEFSGGHGVLFRRTLGEAVVGDSPR